MSTPSYPRLVVPRWGDEQAAVEMGWKGWLSAHVETEQGIYYEVYFSDPVRIRQDMEHAVNDGAPCFAEPALIIVPEVTVETAEASVLYLWKKGFFSYLKPDETFSAP